MKICGIYKILNTKNNFPYVGRATNVKGRWSQHIYLLKTNKDSIHLQNAWNKYGEEKFEFSILEECLIEELKEKEEYWINKLESWNPKKGYNIRRVSEGVERHSDKSKQKMRDNHLDYSGKNNPMYGKKNKWGNHSEASKLKMSEVQSGERNAMFGKSHSETTKQKIGKKNKGRLSKENNPSAKLTSKQVREIRCRYVLKKISLRKLAKEYGVSYSTIQRITNNKTWKEEVV